MGACVHFIETTYATTSWNLIYYPDYNLNELLKSSDYFYILWDLQLEGLKQNLWRKGKNTITGLMFDSSFQNAIFYTKYFYSKISLLPEKWNYTILTTSHTINCTYFKYGIWCNLIYEYIHEIITTTKINNILVHYVPISACTSVIFLPVIPTSSYPPLICFQFWKLYD